MKINKTMKSSLITGHIRYVLLPYLHVMIIQGVILRFAGFNASGVEVINKYPGIINFHWLALVNPSVLFQHS